MAKPQSTPGVPAWRERTHLVYDGATGAILHVHHSVEFEGAAPQAESAEARALRWAGPRPGAKVIEVDRAQTTRGRRIDVATGKLVAV